MGLRLTRRVGERFVFEFGSGAIWLLRLVRSYEGMAIVLGENYGDRDQIFLDIGDTITVDDGPDRLIVELVSVRSASQAMFGFETVGEVEIFREEIWPASRRSLHPKEDDA